MDTQRKSHPQNTADALWHWIVMNPGLVADEHEKAWGAITGLIEENYHLRLLIEPEAITEP
jgi:hypothetical protein